MGRDFPDHVVRLPRRRGVLPSLRAVAIAVLIPLALAGFVHQAFGNDAVEDEVGIQDQHSLYYGVHLPRERVLSRGITIAKQLLEEQRYAESLPVLVRVLHAREDAYPSDEEDEPKSLKTEAARIIAELPEEGQRAYQLEVRAQAERELAQGVRAGADALRRVVSRFPHTEASRLALWLLAQHAFERRDFREAVVCLKAATWDGMPQDQREQINSQLKLAQHAVGLVEQPAGVMPGSAEVAAGMVGIEGEPHQWLSAGGGAGRNPLLDAKPPHLWAEWVSCATGLPEWAASAAAGESGLPSASAASPLVVGGWVVVRGRDRLAGIDRESGKLAWQCQLPSQSSDTPISHQIRRLQGDAAYLKNVLENENRDAVSTRISSDGRLVFAIAARAGSSESRLPNAWREFQGGTIAVGVGVGEQNQLVAVDADSEGKLQWRSSGVAELDGVFFLDSPQVVGDRLFVLAEQDQAICLLQLDPGTGELLWRQTIATVESPVQQEAMRRMVGGSACYVNGLVVCSTGAGLVAAVDPLRRGLEWVYRFPVEGGVQLGRSTPWGRRGSDRWPRDARRQWLWNQVLIINDRVLIGSPESRRLHCVELATGAPLWSTSNANPQLLCAASDETVVVARAEAVAAISLIDGSTRWTTRLPAGAPPSGAGAWFRGGLLLPLSDGSAVLLCPEDGAIKSAWQIGPEGVAGNLAFDGESVYSQSYTGVARFNIADPIAGTLRRQAEIASVNGRDNEVLDDLIAGYQEAGESSIYAARLREVVASSRHTQLQASAASLELAPLFQGRPTPTVLRLARLESAANDGEAQAVRHEVAEYCRSPSVGKLLMLDEQRVASPALLYRNALESVLGEDQREMLQRSLRRDAGPNQSAMLDLVFGPLTPPEGQKSDASYERDSRWAVSQVKHEVSARADRVRRRNGGRISSNPSEFELPLLVGGSALDSQPCRLIASTSGQLVLLNELGEVRSQVDLPKGSPERLQRLASEGAPVAGRWEEWLFVSTGEDVVAIDTTTPDAGVMWSAKRSLLQIEIQSSARSASQMEARFQEASHRQVRLIGGSARGVTVTARDLVACLSPRDGKVLWIVSGLETEGFPTADDQFVYSSPTIRPGWKLDLSDGNRSDLAPPVGEQLAILRGRVGVLQRGEESARFSVVDRATGKILLEQVYDDGVQSCLRGPLLTMVDRSGRLDVFDLASRDEVRLVLHADLKLDAEVVSVVAETLDERLLVGVNHAAPHVHRAAGIMPMDQNAILTGPLFCFNLRSGEQMWPSPVEVSGKAILARQPAKSPLVLLAANVKSRDATGRHDSVQMLAIDVISGRTVFRESGPRNDRGRQYRIQLGQGPRPYYQIALDDSYLTLTAQPSPVPPGPPARAPVERSPDGSLWNVGQALGKLLGEGLGDAQASDPLPEDDD